MGFPRQESWSGLPFSSPRNLPDPEIESRSLALEVDSLPTEPLGKHVVVVQSSSHVQLFTPLWTATCQASVQHARPPREDSQHKIGISCMCMWPVYSKVIWEQTMYIPSYQDGGCHRGLTGSCDYDVDNV